MSLRDAIGNVVRGTLIAAATAAAAFGLLVVAQPFGTAPAPAVRIAADPDAGALAARIDALRLELRRTEAALDTARLQPPVDAYDAQIAAAAERRDLARRRAEAIRSGVEAGTALSALAGIRDSVVIGQLLARQATLDAEIAEQSARLRAGHPTMRALTAQRGALASQIRQEASSIASALDAEAQIDEAQIALLTAQRPAPADTADAATLETRAAAQRAELDALVEAYLDTPPAVHDEAMPAADPLNAVNVLIAALAGGAALLVQLLAATRRRRRARDAADLAAWAADRDAEAAAPSQAEPLRQAS